MKAAVLNMGMFHVSGYLALYSATAHVSHITVSSTALVKGGLAWQPQAQHNKSLIVSFSTFNLTVWQSQP